MRAPCLDRDIEYQADYSAYGVDAYPSFPTMPATTAATGPDLVNPVGYGLHQPGGVLCTADHDIGPQQPRTAPGLDGRRSRFQYTVGLYYEKDENMITSCNGGSLSCRRRWQCRVTRGSVSSERTRCGLTQQKAVIRRSHSGTSRNTLSGTFGLRYFDEDHEVAGVVGWGPGRLSARSSPGCRDTNADSRGRNQRHGVQGQPDLADAPDDALLYVTYSEGYRPGGLNRDPGSAVPGVDTGRPEQLRVRLEDHSWPTAGCAGTVRRTYMDWDRCPVHGLLHSPCRPVAATFTT